ncbi:hypothetical protein PIB30_091466 [Stylosanthes scabra]|uniref:Uncharacterized protein n=1 Tax=Stylosanthes scabra TaxID=79078 RepID=A0ABU6SUZ3_9FABA|nr:hypothetical protein [Stylosanthes scabra]
MNANTNMMQYLKAEYYQRHSDICEQAFMLRSSPEVVEKPGDNSLARLKILYTQAKDLSDSEAQISSLLINQLDTLLPSGQGQPRRRIGKGKHLLLWILINIVDVSAAIFVNLI